MAIPKLIHQTHSSPQDLDSTIHENIKQIRASNPDHCYQFYSGTDREDFIRTAFGANMLATYGKIDPLYGAARADFFRYLLIYHLGGIYLDIKSGLTMPLSQVIQDNDSYVLSRWDHSQDSPHRGWGNHPDISHEHRPAFQQWFLVSEPGHPFLAAVIDKVTANIEGFNAFKHYRNPWNAVIVTTGEVAYTTAIGPLLANHDHRITDIQKEMGFRYSIFLDESGVYGHRTPGRHYTEQLNPLIRQPWPVNAMFSAATKVRIAARKIRQKLRH
jgi:hypothetical protein